MDFSHLEGGLARMLNRLLAEGTATGDPDADALLRTDPNAALIGLMLDQRILAETAFAGPIKLLRRLGHFDMRRMGSMDADAFRGVFVQTPAVHRFTNVMAARLQKLARVLAESYGGDASTIWSGDVDWDTVERRLLQLPGFGPMKAHKMRFVLHYFGHRTFELPG